ncbi:hypothetical protein ACYSNU_17260 [Enterococcus sp. LJL120]|uniref:hypothetical protein n=1 Tax=Enterococcus sp. HY326 TaxID=2971265 RepID=UPI00223F9944|nr:hypothetical protein [Enterococcus sp. HY326]
MNPLLDELLKQQSELYNKALPVYELVTTRNFDRERALLTTNEFYTDWQKLEIFLWLHPEIANQKEKNFLAALDAFYDELKQVLFKEEKDTAQLYSKLSQLKDAFEASDWFDKL